MRTKTRKNTKIRTDDSSGQHVRIKFDDAQAQTVFIAGTFNDWHPNVTPMLAVGGGKWVKDLSLAPGRYEYRFVVDGVWISDPNATEQAANTFGSLNSVIIVGGRIAVA